MDFTDPKRWPLHRLEALHRVAKARAYPFFRDPHAMIALRRALQVRRAHDRSTRSSVMRSEPSGRYTDRSAA